MKLHKYIEAVFSRPKVQRQLVIFFILVLFVPIAFCGFLLYQSQKSLNQHYREQAESDNLRVKSIFFDVTTNLYNVAESIVYDDTLPALLHTEYTSAQEVKAAVDSYHKIQNIMSKDTSIFSVDIYTLNDTIGDYGNFHTVTAEIRESTWFSKASGQASVFWQTQSREDSRGNTYWELVLYRRIPLPKAHSFAVLAIAVSDNYLRSRIDNTTLDSIVTVNQNPVFYSDIRSYLGSSMPVKIDYDRPLYAYSGPMELGRENIMAAVSTLVPLNSEDKMYIVAYNPDAVRDANTVLRNYVLIIIAVILISCLQFYVYSRYFSARVLTLRSAMHQASHENYDIIDSFTGNDEISETFQDLRIMIEEIKEKEAKIYQAQIREQEIVNRQQQMEFKMLASQINPHFLYNTLETIRMKAFTAGNREVANAIKLLGKSLRYVLENTGTVSVSLAKELNYIHTYIEIQRLRFGERVNFREEIEPGLNLEEYQLLPLMLQPIVENSISHGLKGMDIGGLITMKIYRTRGELCIFVSDNGKGMTCEELLELREKINWKDESRTRSIGLYNINQRLLLCYGAKYRLEITSEKDRGQRLG